MTVFLGTDAGGWCLMARKQEITFPQETTDIGCSLLKIDVRSTCLFTVFFYLPHPLCHPSQHMRLEILSNLRIIWLVSDLPGFVVIVGGEVAEQVHVMARPQPGKTQRTSQNA